MFLSPVSSILANTPAPPFALALCTDLLPLGQFLVRRMAFSGRPAGRPISAPRARRATAGPFPARRPPHRVPGLVGPGRIFKSSGRHGPRRRRSRAGSSSQADVAGSGRSGPGPALRVEWMSWTPTLRARRALLHGSRTRSRCSWSAARRATRTSRRRSAAQRVVALPPAESRGDHGARRGTASLPSGRHPVWSRRHGGRRGTLCPLARLLHGCTVARRYCHLVV